MELFCYGLILGLIILIFLQEDEVETPEVERIFSIKQDPSPIHDKEDPPTPDLPYWQKIKDNYLKEILSFQGEHIVEVYYAIVNDPDGPFEFGHYHSSDKGVLLQFSSGKWLNWIWEEDGIHGTPEIRLSFVDERETLKDEFTIFNRASNTDIWNQAWAKKVKQIHCEFEELAKDQEYLSKMILQFDSFAITIRSTEEPDPAYFANLDDITFSPEWTIIHL